MAEIHAIVNGNWNAASTWDWNRVPDVDDEVYLDGFTIQGYSNMLISVKSINNVSYGGHINITSGGVCIFNCNFAVGNVDMITSTYCELQVNGNVHIFGVGLLQNNTTGARPFTVNGNVTIDSTSLLYKGAKGAIVINGNFYAPNSSIPTATGQNNTVINGNVVVNYITNTTSGSGLLSVGGDFTIKQTSVNNSISVSGTLFIEEYASLSVTTLTIGGGIYYFNRNSDNLNLNAGRINPTANFFATNLFNVPDYPDVDNVKIGIIYGHGVYTGTYDIENLLPPESVVLKDYVYDNGDKVGTLENEVTVTNTNTINVYPYKKRQ